MTDIPREQINAFDAAVSRASKIVIVSHVHPDGDALGSVTSMQSFLREARGKESLVILPGPVPPNLSFITEGVDIMAGLTPLTERAIAEADLVIALDLNSLHRTDVLESPLRASGARKILIDHHPCPENSEFDLIFSRTDVSSACEHIYQVLMSLPDIGSDAGRLPSRCARSLMTGMTTDTNNFANSVFPSTLRMASSLLEAGVDRDSIIQSIYNSSREAKVRLWAHMLDRKLVIMDCGAAYMVLDRQERDGFGVLEGETDGLVNIPLQIRDVRLSALLTEEDGCFRVSLRSKKGVDVSRLSSAHFHGGGHVLASGGKIFFPGDISSPEEAGPYFEDITARFMREDAAAQS